MKLWIFVALFVASFVALLGAQSPGKVWTNADLRKPMAAWEPAPAVSPETLQGLRDRQPVVDAAPAPAASMKIASRPADGPFGRFHGPARWLSLEDWPVTAGVPLWIYGAQGPTVLTPYGALQAPAGGIGTGPTPPRRHPEARPAR